VFRDAGYFHELSCGDGVWMTDIPAEQAQANPVFRRYAGDVLVGGLGLGYAATRIAMKKRVRRVTVIEVSPEVIELVSPYFCEEVKSKITVVQGDLLEYLKTTDVSFNRAFYDIWQSDGEGTFFETVLPLLQNSPSRVRYQPDCWNEDVMRGQLFWSLQSPLTMLSLQPHLKEALEHKTVNDVAADDLLKLGYTLDELCTERGTIWHDWKVPFFRWYRTNKPADEVLERGMAIYAGQYGRPRFEELWRHGYRS